MRVFLTRWCSIACLAPGVPSEHVNEGDINIACSEKGGARTDTLKVEIQRQLIPCKDCSSKRLTLLWQAAASPVLGTGLLEF